VPIARGVCDNVVSNYMVWTRSRAKLLIATDQAEFASKDWRRWSRPSQFHGQLLEAPLQCGEVTVFIETACFSVEVIFESPCHLWEFPHPLRRGVHLALLEDHDDPRDHLPPVGEVIVGFLPHSLRTFRILRLLSIFASLRSTGFERSHTPVWGGLSYYFFN
jgi:hypothetical protein